MDENFILIETTIKGNKEMNCFHKDDVLKFSHSSLKIINKCRQKHNKIYRGLRTITIYNCYAKLVSGNCTEEDNFSWLSPCEVRGAASCFATIKKCPKKSSREKLLAELFIEKYHYTTHDTTFCVEVQKYPRQFLFFYFLRKRFSP